MSTEKASITIPLHEYNDLVNQINDLRQKLEAALQVQFDAAAFEKVKRERDSAEACCVERGEVLQEVHNLDYLQEHYFLSAKVIKALSPSCGQGFVRASDLDRTIEVLGGYWELSDDEYRNITEVEIARLKTLRGGTP